MGVLDGNEIIHTVALESYNASLTAYATVIKSATRTIAAMTAVATITGFRPFLRRFSCFVSSASSALSSADLQPFKAASLQPASPSSAFSLDKNSFASSPNSEQIFLICAALGTLLPDSHLKTVCLDTPSLSANCCCDSPFSSLKTISLSLKSIIITTVVPL